MSRNIGKNKSKNVGSKYSQKLLDDGKQSATDALKTASKKAIQQIEEATGNLIGNKIADRITGKQKVLKTSPLNNGITRKKILNM